MRLCVGVALATVSLGLTGGRGAAQVTLVPQTSGTGVLLQAVSVVDSHVVWVSGHRATFVRTLDGGRSWRAATVPGPDSLQFRDVHAVDARVAYLLSAGPGDMSRIYKTVDGGAVWVEQFRNAHPEAFYDCLDFWDADRGLAFSDAVAGRLRILRTLDGGRTWDPIPAEGIPPARGTEGGFAASGTCLVADGESEAWIGSGAGEVARVYRSWDVGTRWTATPTPLVAGTGTSGITTVVVGQDGWAMVLGGEIAAPKAYADNVAVTADGGRTWALASRPPFPGAVYGASRVPGRTGWVVGVGPGGAAYTPDRGRRWHGVDSAPYWAVGVASARAAWLVGPNGRITRVAWPDP